MKNIFISLVLAFLMVSCNVDNADYLLTDYLVDIELDTINLQMHGNMSVHWVNASDSSISLIPFAFQAGINDSLIVSILCDDMLLDYEYRVKENDGFTGFVVRLDDPVRPHSEVALTINFSTPKNEEYFRESMLFFQEHMPSVLYFDNGTFSSNFQIHSNYDVNIKYPVDFELAPTGFVNRSDTTDGYVTAYTQAREVPSYGVVMLKNVEVEQALIGDVLVRSLFFEDDRKWGEKLLAYTKDIIPFYIDTLGFYPQKNLTIIPGYPNPYGGWPVCPNVVGIHRGIDKKGAKAETHANWIMAHEVAHQYWGFNYLLDPLEYPMWFGISMGIYTDMLYVNARNIDMNHNKYFFSSYEEGVEKGYNTTIMQTIDTLVKQKFDWNNVIMHGKSFAVLRLLEKKMGKEQFFNLYKYCLEQYKGVNVTVDMFQQDCERFANADLESFFQTWFYSNRYLQYKVTDAISHKVENEWKTTLTVEKVGEASFKEIEIGCYSNDSLVQTVSFDGVLDTANIEFSTKVPITTIILDPLYLLPLMHRENFSIHDSN